MRLGEFWLLAICAACPQPENGRPPAVSTISATPVTPATPAVQEDVVAVQPQMSASGSGTIDATSSQAAVTGVAAREGDPGVAAADINELRGHNLLVPVAGVRASDLRDSFYDKRGNRVHHAMDIMAARGTPVLSVDSGSILKLHNSVPGGLTVYAADPGRKFTYMYGHLDRFSPALLQGQNISRGDTIGFVGTTGNADPNAPHLHIAIMRTDDASKWWKGTPLNPKLVLVK